jgi:hypothetical protein
MRIASTVVVLLRIPSKGSVGASLSPSMYRWVVWIDRWPAGNWTSRNEPPTLWTKRAARVMNVRRPEWDERPSRRSARYAVENQITIFSGLIGPPRSDRTTGPVPSVMRCQTARASRNCECSGICRFDSSQRDPATRWCDLCHHSHRAPCPRSGWRSRRPAIRPLRTAAR